MGKHLLAIMVNGKKYRDTIGDVMDDEEFHQFVDGHLLPKGISAYHYSGNIQWERVLQLPEYNPPTYRSVKMEVEIAFSEYGACRRCDRVPADGLWQGKDYREYDRRIYPYRGYVCEQCAQQMEEEAGTKGRWIPNKKKR